MNEKTWCVYKHTFPNGKVYIGTTSQKPEVRWANGAGYRINDKMYSDIVFYGWRNIAHEILFSGLDEATAKQKERELIAAYGVDGRDKTYNTMYTFYNGAKSVPWLDYKVTEDNVKEYWVNFVTLDDYWLEAYIRQMGAHPFGTQITVDGVEINFYIPDGKGNMMRKVLLVRHPKQGMTFREVHDWLNTAPQAELIIDKTFPIPDEIKAMAGAL